MNKLNKIFCAAAIASISTFASADVIINSGSTGTTGAATELDIEANATSTLVGGACAGSLCAPTPVSTFTESGFGDVTGLLPGGFGGVFDSNLNGSWGISFVYSGVSGDFTSGPAFNNGGAIDMFYSNANGTEQIASLLISGGSVVPGNSYMTGTVDYSWLATATDTGNTDADAKTFFQNDVASYGHYNFYDIWNDNAAEDVTWRFDFTIVNNTNVPYIGDALSASRSTDLNGQIAFAVTEPSSIALLGLGLLGFAAARRKSL